MERLFEDSISLQEAIKKRRKNLAGYFFFFFFEKTEMDLLHHSCVLNCRPAGCTTFRGKR